MVDLSVLFYSAQPAELARGYRRDPDSGDHVCLVCGLRGEQGRIYRSGDSFLDAERHIREHSASAHGAMLEYLLGLDKRVTGLSAQHCELMRRFARGDEDKAIAAELGIAASTVRNHRFALREKENQARVFLAAMLLMKEGFRDDRRFIPVRRSATMVDDRYAVTEREREEILAKYFDGSRLREFPLKQKRKMVILDRIAKSFEARRRYTEREVNDTLSRIFGDYVTIRRYLIEYGYLDREPDCSAYWVKE